MTHARTASSRRRRSCPSARRARSRRVTHRELEELGRARSSSATPTTCYLRPGDRLIARRGGLHRFIGWDRPILTDSGGYQVFSLAARRTHRRGRRRTSGRTSTAARAPADARSRRPTSRRALGSDIAMVLDECLSCPAEPPSVRASMERTLRWARRGRGSGFAPSPSREATRRPAAMSPSTNPGQAQFGIVQGGVFPELRRLSALETLDGRLRGATPSAA